MKIEHIAYMVEDPVKVAEWYVRHLGFEIKRSLDSSPFTHFLADSSGMAMLEIYNNPSCKVPDYASMDPLNLHLALVSQDVRADRAKLIEAGATPAGDVDDLPNGDVVAMHRDPWGFPVQFVSRATPMLEG